METLDPVAGSPVLVVVDDVGLGELLTDALADAGHAAVVTSERAQLPALVAAHRFQAAIVDLDTRARDGADVVVLLRQLDPHLRVIILLPCGGVAPARERVPYHLALEKPARLQVLLSALAAAGIRRSCN